MTMAVGAKRGLFLAVAATVVSSYLCLSLPPGCGSPARASGSFNVTVEVGRTNRTFQLYTPFRLSSNGGSVGPPEDPRPLVMNWHGCNAHYPELDYHNEISKVTESAMDYGYYVLTPVGTSPDYSNSVGWNADGIDCGAPGLDDFEFFETMMQFARQELCVDMSRVYVTGFSTGGFMTYGIACRYSRNVTAIATDAGSLSRTYHERCMESSDVSPVPVQAFHSLADPTVPFNGTDVWSSQKDMDDLWRAKNGCDGSEAPTISFESDTTTCRVWDCPDAPVETCALKGIDHCWYGGRSGGFPSCVPRSGDVDVTAHMFASWEAMAASSTN